MKKFVLIILTACLLLGMAGCNRAVTDEEVNAIEPCVYEDGEYRNETFGMAFRAPEGWTCSDWEAILEQNEWSAEEDLKTQVLDSLAKPYYYYELFAERDDAKASVNVCVENVAVLGNPDDTEEGYVARTLEITREHFKNLEAQQLVITQTEETFAGRPHHGYYVSCKMGSTPYYYKAVYIKEGIYAAVITVTSTEEDLTDEVLELFYEA